MFGHRLSTDESAEWCRAVGTSLRSGISTLQTMRNAAGRGTPRQRRASADILEGLQAGEDIGDALVSRSYYFPPLLTQLGKVGARTGHLPEVLAELERFFRFQISLRRRLMQQVSWPLFQLVVAILVIALVIYLLGILPAADVLGLGLRGGSGAMIWLGGWAALAGLGFFGYRTARNNLKGRLAVDRFLLRVPVLGPVLRTLALSRATLAMHLTMDSGLSLKRSLPLALSASDNAAIAELAKPIVRSVNAGGTLAEAFREHPLFPDEMIDRLDNAEQAGTVPEAMRHFSVELSQRAEHQLHLLNQALAWVVWGIVTIIIVFFIIRIALVAYIRPIYDALDALPG